MHDRNNWTSRSGKTTLTDAIKKTLTQREERNISLTSSIEYGAILVVSAIDGIMSQTAEQIMIAHHMGCNIS